MLTLVHIKPCDTTSPAENASLVADYLAFDRQRTSRRQYMKAFGGMAIIVLLGGAFERVPWNEARVVAGLLLAPPTLLGVVEFIRWRGLVRRLNTLRAQAHAVTKS